MLEVTNYCVIETVLTTAPTKRNRMEINTDFFPNQKVLLGKKIGDKYKKCELSKFCKDVETEYKITNIKIHSEKDKQIQQLILTLRENHNFEGFIHSTELDNFKSIVRLGKLIPRNVLLRTGINFTDRAEQSVLIRTNDYIKSCCRFYYTYDTPTNFRAGYEKKVCMVFDEALAYNHQAQFSSVNACYGRYSNDISEVMNYDWEGIFERGSYKVSKIQREAQERSQNVYVDASRLITATRNAEFLICGEVPISFIKKIVVYDRKTYNEMRIICDDVLFSKVVLREGK